MNRRAIGMAAFVLLLAAANLWRWSAGAAPLPERSMTDPGTVRAEDLVLHLAPVAQVPPPLRRDPFAPPEAAVEPVEATPEPPPPVALLPEEPPVKTAEEVAREAAQQELSELRLVGIVFREGKGRAYLVRGEEVFLVAAGERLGRFAVEKVSTDHVELRDPDTQLGGRVSVNGE